MEAEIIHAKIVIPIGKTKKRAIFFYLFFPIHFLKVK
jgi:hypothetical protein